jgi:hypothetical protein
MASTNSRVLRDAAANLFLGQFDKPLFDEVDPRRAGRGEVHMVPRSLREPPPDQGRFMRRIVVENQMNVEMAWHRGVDGIEKPAEFPRTVARVTLANDTAAAHIERGKECRRPVADVVVRMAFRLTGTQRQDGRTAIEGLDLRFLVDAQHQRAFGRLQVQPDDVADLLDKERVFRQLERFGPMRLQRKGPPNAAHRGLAEATRSRHRARTPVRRVARRRFQGHRDHPFHVVIGDAPRRAGARFIEQPIEPTVQKSPSPFAGRRPTDPFVLGDVEDRFAFRTRQDNPRTQRQSPRTFA